MTGERGCPACHHASSFLFRTRDVNRGLSSETFGYYRCTRCGLVFLHPVPEDLDTYYPKQYYGDPPSLGDLTQAARAIESYKLELVQRFVPGGRLLEIGPGLGGFACLAKEAGYEIDAIEMDRDCCAFLSDVVGVRAINSGEPASVMSAEGPYDVVVLWHVIEHLPDPWETLDVAGSRLKPGGVVVIAAPNPDALQFRLLGRRWAHVDAPRHVWLIPLDVLIRRARDHGLEEVFRTTTDEGGIGWNAFGWRESLANMAPRALRAPARFLGSALTRLVAPFERTGLHGATFTVVLQKDSER